MNNSNSATPSEVRDHLPLIELLEGETNVSQRQLAERMGIALTRVNRMIRGLVRDGVVEVVDQDVRPFSYRLTDSGRTYRQRLNQIHYRTVVGSFRKVQNRIRGSLAVLARSGVRRVAFYGAGDIMEVAYPLAGEVGLRVVTVVDDDPARQGRRPDGIRVEAPTALQGHAPDAIVITTFRHADEIGARLSGRTCTRIVEL